MTGLLGSTFQTWLVFAQDVFTNNFLARLPVNIIDKGLAVGVALIVRSLILAYHHPTDHDDAKPKKMT